MKNLLLISSILLLSLTNCKENGNKGISQKDEAESVVSDNNMLFDETKSYSYISSDGSRANVDYDHKETRNTIIIKSNNVKYVLDKKDGDADSQIYERNGVQAKMTKDSMFISQDNIVIPMALVEQ